MNRAPVSQLQDARAGLLARRAFVSSAVLLCGIAAVFLAAFSALPQKSRFIANVARISLSPRQDRNAVQHTGALGWTFEPNLGQSDSRVKFLARARDASISLTNDSLYVEWNAARGKNDGTHAREHDHLQMQFVASDAAADPAGEEQLPGKTNYLIGRNPAHWHTNVPNYSAVRYKNLYPDVDARIYGGVNGLEYDLKAKGADDLNRVALRMVGTRVQIDSRGDLVMRTGNHVLKMERPYIYQPESGTRRTISGGYRILANGDIGFTIGEHREDLPVVIDPVVSIAYTSFLGGSGAEKGNSVAVDSSGNIYVGGTTTDFTTFPETATCNDIKSVACSGAAAGATSNLFVAKINPSQSGASQLVYLTFIGGSANDQGGIVALDNSASPPNLAILGWTTSPDFPTTLGSVPTGPVNLTISKLNGSGNSFVYSEYYGGNGAEATQGTGAMVTNATGGGIATDAAGDIFVTSDTTSTNLPQPTVPNGFQQLFEGTGTAPVGTNNDGFFCRFDPSGNLLYSTYFGIAANVGSTGVAVDTSGNAYVAGFTSQPSNIFPPAGTNTFQSSYGGGADDGFVIEVNPSPPLLASSLVYASFLGGNGSDQAFSIAVDASNPANAYVTGATSSTDFVSKTGLANGFQTSLGSAATSNAFLAAINQAPTTFVPSLTYASYLGGTANDSGSGVAVVAGSPSQVLVTGKTTSNNFPVICPGQNFTGTQDAFVAEFNPTAAGSGSLLVSTFFGGSASTEADAIATDSSGDAIIFGETLSPDYPLAGNPQNGLQPICTSCALPTPLSDAFLTKSAISTAPSACVAFNPASAAFGSFPVGVTNVPPFNGVVANDGNVALNFTAINITGTNAADFQLLSSTCNAATPVTPGGTCDVSIGFTPTVAGSETATLQFTDNAAGNPQGLNLTGTGTAPEVTLTTSPPTSPPAVTFGSVTVNTTSPAQTITLTNSGNATLAISSVAIDQSVGNPADFVVTSTGASACGASGASSIPPNGTCTITVQFTPNAAGPLTGQIDVADDANNNPAAVQTIALSGTGVAQTFIVNFNPASLTFPNQNVGTISTPQSLTLTNNGTGTLNISSITLAGTNANQFQIDSTGTNCPVGGAGVGPNGGSCVIAVDFAPTAVGTAGAGIAIADNASNSPQSVPLSGTGAGAIATLSGNMLTFGSVSVGSTSATQAITVTNNGNTNLVFSSIGLTGTNPGDFQITNQTTCAAGGSGIAPSGSCSIVVDFVPQASGSRFASVSMADNAAGSPQTISLSGTGSQAVAMLSQNLLAFGNVNVGNTSTLPSVTLTNTGNQALTISSVSINPSVGTPGDFAFAGANTCKTVGALQPTQSCTITVSFTPAAQGNVNGQLDITDNAAPTTQSISLTGTGTAPGVSLAPASLAFSGQNPGTPPSPAQTVTLQSTGTGPLTISSISIIGANASDFAETNNCPVGPGVALNPGSSCSINVTFAPMGTGARAASLSISDNVSPSPQTVSLGGIGTAPAVHFSLFAIKFADTVVGAPSGVTPVQAVNSGNGPLVITNVGFVGANPGDFQASGSCVGANGVSVSVPANSSCDINVNFVPTAVGSRSATLSVTDNASGSPQQSVAISGTATDFQLGPISGGGTSATVTAGDTATFSLQISSVNGFAGATTMSCANTVPASTCNISPAQIAVSANQAAPFTVTVATTARKAAVPGNRFEWPGRRWPFVAIALLLLLVLAACACELRRGRLVPVLALLGGMLLASCAGGGSSGMNGTPAGNYTITISGAAGGATRTVTLSVTVQ